MKTMLRLIAIYSLLGLSLQAFADSAHGGGHNPTGARTFASETVRESGSFTSENDEETTAGLAKRLEESLGLRTEQARPVGEVESSDPKVNSL